MKTKPKPQTTRPPVTLTGYTPHICPKCGSPSQAYNGDALLCLQCTDEEAKRADERAVYGGPDL